MILLVALSIFLQTIIRQDLFASVIFQQAALTVPWDTLQCSILVSFSILVTAWMVWLAIEQLR